MNICRNASDDDDNYERTTHLVRVPRAEAEQTSVVKINIKGMSSQSCVTNIERIIGKRPDVVSLRVNLEERAGYIKYRTHDTTPEILVEAIKELGYSASPSLSDVSTQYEMKFSSILNSNTCVIHIDGMTCTSCVKNITGESTYEDKTNPGCVIQHSWFTSVTPVSEN